MGTPNFVLEIFKIAIPALLSTVAIIISVLSLNRTKRREDFENRPVLALNCLSLYPDIVKIYAGENVNLDAESINDEDISIILDYPDDMHKMYTVGENDEYIFINLCPKKSNVNDAILAFDFLNLEINFNNDKVSELIIKRSYLITPQNKDKYDELRCYRPFNCGFLVSDNFIKIPIAFACLKEQKKLINLSDTNNYIKSDNKNSINFLKSPSEAKKYIRFIEMAYLLQCRTINNDSYYYSLIISKEEEMLQVPKIQNGKRLFNKKLEEAIQKSEVKKC